MCGYDPLKWSDIYETEEEYIAELLEDLEERTRHNDNRIDKNRKGHSEFAGDYGK